MPPLVLQTEDLDAGPAAWLAEKCELVRCAPGEARFEELLPRAEALIVRTYTRIDAAMLGRAPRLRAVGRAGVGLDNIDLAACRARAVRVVYTPEANTRAVVEWVAAALLDALRPRTYLREAPGLGRWRELRRELVAERELGQLSLGVYGMGRIGSRVARLGAAFDMTVIYTDLVEVPPGRRHGARPAPPERLLAECDVITVHIDERPTNRRLFSRDAFSRLKENAIFINTSRGFVVDAHALADFLRANPAALALLDVHDPEPFGPEYPLLGLPNARLTPHIASGTAAAKLGMSWVVRDVWRVLCGEPAHFPAEEIHHGVHGGARRR